MNLFDLRYRLTKEQREEVNAEVEKFESMLDSIDFEFNFEEE